MVLMTAGYMPIPFFTTLTRIKDRAIFVKPSIIEKDRRKKGNDYYQTVVKYVSKIKAPGTTAEKVQNIWD